MSGTVLKWIAIITMLIDHTGAILFPQYGILRIIGRVSFPILCFLISEGYLHTSNIKKYALRLLGFAFISEIPYDLAFNKTVFDINNQNVMFTLVLGLFSIWIIDKKFKNQPLISLFLVGLAVISAELIHSSYGWFGVMLVISFYMLRQNKVLNLSSFAILNQGFSFLSGITQSFAIFAIIPIYLYNQERGKYRLKWFFYVFYPIHLLALYIIKICM